MTPLLYSIVVTLPDAQTAERWLRWLRDGHIAEVLAGGARAAEIVQVEGPAHCYEVRYRFPGRDAFARYERDHAPRLRAEGLRLFPPEKGVTYRRAVGLVLEAFPAPGSG